jgi:hypothetical protein
MIAAVFGQERPSGLRGGFPSLFQIDDAPEQSNSFQRFAPLAWSPVRRELAFGGTVGGADAVIPPGWLLPASDEIASDDEAVRQAIWLLPEGESQAIPAAVSEGLFSAPCWSPDGDALYYVRWEPLANGEGSMSLLRHPRTGAVETIFRETGRYPFAERRALPFETAAASPDGLWIAAPWLGPQGLIIVDLEKRRVSRRFQQASAPVWSPDGSALAYFVAESSAPMVKFNSGKQTTQKNAAQLMVAPRSALTNSAVATPIGKAMGLFDGSQPARWDQTGHTLLALRSTVEPPSSYDPPRVQLHRVSVSEGRVGPAVFKAQTTEVRQRSLNASFAFAPRSDAVFIDMPRTDTRMLIERQDLSSGQTDPPWHPFDDVDSPLPAPLGSLAVSHDGKRLAMRFGRVEANAPVAIRVLDRDQTHVVHADDANDLRAAAVLASSARRTLLRVQADNAVAFQMTNPGAWDQGREMYRLNPFPRRNQIDAMDDQRLLTARRLAADGLAFLGRRSADHRAGSAQVELAFTEFALQLHYIREEFAQALRCIERLNAESAPTPERRLMLAIIRAQCLEATAGSASARMSLEAVLQSREFRSLRSKSPDDAPSLFLKRIEEIRSGHSLVTAREDADAP